MTCIERNVGKGSNRILVEGLCSADHPLYSTWVSMRVRCQKPYHISYPFYGGRGIKVCDRWDKSFSDFVSDMGSRPEGYTLDREDSDGDYCPSNCRWATREEQIVNRGRRKDNSSGTPNIRYRGDRKKYYLEIKRSGRKLSKSFDTIEEAIQARDNFLKESK